MLLIDADPQGNVGHAFGIRRTATLRELMTGERTLDDVIVRDVRPNLDVIPSTAASFSLEAQLAGSPQREMILARRLKAIAAGRYEAIIVDCSAAMNLLL